MSQVFEEEAQPPEIFDIPELVRFYKYPFVLGGGGRLLVPKLERNGACVCGSLKKLKKCCGEFNQREFDKLISLIHSESLKRQTDSKDELKNVNAWLFRR